MGDPYRAPHDKEPVLRALFHRRSQCVYLISLGEQRYRNQPQDCEVLRVTTEDFRRRWAKGELADYELDWDCVSLTY